MLTTLVISCCLVFIFLQLTNPYISLAKNAIKHTTTETYLISYRLANIHNIIKTISLAAYANAKYGLLLKVTSGVTGFSGKCYCARISGHTYVAHLDGVAYLGTVAVAKTGFNTVSWRP